MKWTALCFAIALPLLTASCATSTPSADTLPRIEQNLLTPCPRSPEIVGPLTFDAAITIIAEDSVRYEDCRDRHNKLIEAVGK